MADEKANSVDGMSALGLPVHRPRPRPRPPAFRPHGLLKEPFLAVLIRPHVCLPSAASRG